MKSAGGKTFIKRGNTWVDSSLPPNKKDKLINIVAFSEGYFKLITANPGIAKYLSVGENVIVVFKSKIYYVAKKVEKKIEKKEEKKVEKKEEKKEEK